MTALYYTIIFNNVKFFKILLKYNANPYIVSNEGNIISLILNKNQYKILKYICKKSDKIKLKKFIFENDETILQAATYSSKKNDNKIINLLYKIIESSKLSIDLNNRSSYDGITILQQSIITNNINLFKKLINNDIVNINLTNYYGFSPLHFIIQIGRLNFLDEFLKLPIENINFNILNINNDFPLHLIFINNLKIDLTIFIKNTNLNIIKNDN